MDFVLQTLGPFLEPSVYLQLLLALTTSTYVRTSMLIKMASWPSNTCASIFSTVGLILKYNVALVTCKETISGGQRMKQCRYTVRELHSGLHDSRLQLL